MTMIAFQQIKELTKSLSPEEKKVLVAELIATLQEGNGEELSAAKKQRRILGLHAHLGEGWMSNDFHNELPDSFWLGQE